MVSVVDMIFESMASLASGGGRAGKFVCPICRLPYLFSL